MRCSGAKRLLEADTTSAGEQLAGIVLGGDGLETGQVGAVHLAERDVAGRVVGVLWSSEDGKMSGKGPIATGKSR